MARAALELNERAWAIDVIVEANRIVDGRQGLIRRVGGEHTLNRGGRVLFPDVLLFSDSASSRLVQGWELKMPDTPINDPELLANAEAKARRLGLGSFLVWNGASAALHVRSEDDEYGVHKQWDCGGLIRTRMDVKNKKAAWLALLREIMSYMDDSLTSGFLKDSPLKDSLSGKMLAELISERADFVAASIKSAAGRDAALRQHVDLWWLDNEESHLVEKIGGKPHPDAKWRRYSETILARWIAKFLLAHVLAASLGAARFVRTIGRDSTPESVLGLFVALSQSNDFVNVFETTEGERYLDRDTWRAMSDLNALLSEIRVESVEQAILQGMLENGIEAYRRKSAGMYATPERIGALMARIGIETRDSVSLDPFCGSGSIARASLEFKRELGASWRDALSTTWANDKFAYPVSAATLALLGANAVDALALVHKADSTTLLPGAAISFIDPRTGRSVRNVLPEFDAILTNPPFIRFERWRDTNAGAAELGNFICAQTGIAIPGRADIVAYLIGALWRLAKAGGRIVLITPNSWLGADWGSDFREILLRMFRLEAVVTSGCGRWFPTADVVTNMLSLVRRHTVLSERDPTERIRFFTLEQAIDEATSQTAVETIATCISQGRNRRGSIRAVEHSVGEIERIEALGLTWSALFTHLEWLESAAAALVPAAGLFEISRGERRGWDDLFYPDDHSIERAYLQPVLLTSATSDRLMMQPDGQAFCCSETLAELRRRNHKGALAWIRKFASIKNGTGRPLPEVLGRSGMQWYEMRVDAKADFAITMNPGKRLFVGRLSSRAFVNQRLIALKAKNTGLDLDLCHALLNSTLTLFQLEGLGFGRGLGALDLNATKLRNSLRILDPTKVSKGGAVRIKTAFAPLMKRDILDVRAELRSNDRVKLDEAILGEFGLQSILPHLRDSLLELYGIRAAVDPA